jgi:hypothetical protein
MAWSAFCAVAGEPERQGSTTFVWVLDPTLRPRCVGPALVRDRNYLCERVIGGGDSTSEAETPRARRRLVGGGTY